MQFAEVGLEREGGPVYKPCGPRWMPADPVRWSKQWEMGEDRVTKNTRVSVSLSPAFHFSNPREVLSVAHPVL